MIDLENDTLSPARLKVRLESAKEANNEAQKEQAAQTKTELLSLTKDSEHLSAWLKRIGFGVVGLLFVGWQLYLHLDDRIESKFALLSNRIDAAAVESNNRDNSLGERLDNVVSIVVTQPANVRSEGHSSPSPGSAKAGASR